METALPVKVSSAERGTEAMINSGGAVKISARLQALKDRRKKRTALILNGKR